MNHIDWNNGVLNKALPSNQKTILTLCGKRVKSHRINNDNADCPRCQEINLQTAKLIKEIK